MPPTIGAEAWLLLRLAVAAILSAALGWEREKAGKAAGLRTHMLVGMAAALYTALSTLIVTETARLEPGLRADPIRVVQAVALGIGFLGGGVISAQKSEGHGSGLTTAASIWSTAAIGIAVGLGYYVLACGATVLQLIVLHGLTRLERAADPTGRPS
jgi:putative Mg2+ transporter-C (MgtC) family protein